MFVGSVITDAVANLVIAQLLFLEQEDPDKDIDLYINSPGGSATAGLAIYDAMQLVKPEVSTICVGMAASAAALLLAGGAPGKRFSLPYSRILVHQPRVRGIGGQASDIERHARELLNTRRVIEEIYHKHTGQPLEKIRADLERDFFMDAEQAVQYGILDKVITRESRQ